MKIAFVFDGLQVGGIERVGVDYIRLLRKMGHEIDIINLAPARKAMEKEIDESCKIFRINMPKKMTPGFYSRWTKRGAAFKAAYLIANIALNVYGIFFKWLISRRSIRSEYDVAIAFSGHYNDLTFVAHSFVKARKKLCWVHGAIYGYVLWSESYLRLYQKIHNLVVLSDLCQGDVLTTNQWLNLNIHKIYNPSYIGEKKIDEIEIFKKKKRFGDYILMVGRFESDKDQETVVKALKYLNEKYGFDNNLVFVGDGSTRRKIEDFVKKEDLSNHVFFEGTKKAVESYFKSAYIFVHSSPLEGLPTTIIEALYFGLPVVASDSMPGVREVLEGGKYGWIVPVADYIAMGEAIYTLYQNKDVYNRYKTDCTSKFIDFAPETIEEKCDSLLRELE